MGIYLGQLPPAEIARLKAELAETLIANFSYPRFFDYRTDSLRMRPVDRAKRQEVWMYLSSVDFTAWSRLDLMSPDFQRQIERLLILFVQRNRSFFGEQGRKRMSDIRMLIGSSSTSVVQGLRNHVTGQRQNNPPFGSPRAVVSWSSSGTSNRADPTWEHISGATMLLQQQLQETRGEVKPAPVADSRTSNGNVRRTGRTNGLEFDIPPSGAGRVQGSSPTGTGPLPGSINPPPLASPASNGASRAVPPRPSSTQLPPAASISAATTSPMPPAPTPTPFPPAPVARRSEVAEPVRKVEPAPQAPPPTPLLVPQQSAPAFPTIQPTPLAPAQGRGVPQPSQPMPSMPATVGNTAATPRDTTAMVIGEDDMAIFEQMRHQLMVWLRVEAVRLGLEITGLGPSQLLELLRQQNRFDETRLQVVSTLLNLANQIIKTGQVSVIDYKQALMFHLMHTRQL